MVWHLKSLQRHFKAIFAVVILINAILLTNLLLSTRHEPQDLPIHASPNLSEKSIEGSEDDDEGGAILSNGAVQTQYASNQHAQLFHRLEPLPDTPPLLPALQRETGMQRLISVLEQQIATETEGGCAKLSEARDAQNPCISELLLTGSVDLRTFAEGYTRSLLQGMRGALDRQNNLNRVSHSKPAYPLVSGDGFKFAADVQCDTKPNQRDNCNFDPLMLHNRSLIFVNTHDVPRLVAKLPNIKTHFFMITHNRDRAIPGPQGQPLLESPYLLRWFGKNIEAPHPKLVPIPIGIENRWYKNGRRPERYIDAAYALLNTTATHPVLTSFKLKAQYRSRTEALTALRRNGLADKPQKVASHQGFLELIRQHQFVLSPPGNGFTCHRTWETLYMGRVPIVMTSPMDHAYKHMPVVTVSNWNEVTKEFLNRKWQEMMREKFDFDKLWQPHWLLMMLKNALQTP